MSTNLDSWTPYQLKIMSFGCIVCLQVCFNQHEVAAAISFPLSQVEVVDKASDFKPFEETPAPAPKPNTNCFAPMKPAPSSIC
ncbi:hypothetical protein LXL04_012415 [Taraxacum kok-saghyz]